jgi:hypothetical protein
VNQIGASAWLPASVARGSPASTSATASTSPPATRAAAWHILLIDRNSGKPCASLSAIASLARVGPLRRAAPGSRSSPTTGPGRA